MTDKPTSIVTFLLDRSGSMGLCKPATIEAFNGYLSGLQAETEAHISFTFLQFDSGSLDKICVAIPVSDARPLTNATYQPRGGTPLIDAAVKTIKAVEASLASRSDNPRIVVCIQTDGQENESTEHTWEELKGIVTAKTAEGWQFNFMGAGIEGYDQAAKMGIGAMNTVSYDSTDLRSTAEAFTASAKNASDYVSMRSMNTSYSASQRAASGDRFGHLHGVGATTLIPAAPVSPLPTARRPPGTLDLSNSPTVQAQRKRRQSVPDIAL
jgi:hypothetical protein